MFSNDSSQYKNFKVLSALEDIEKLTASARQAIEGKNYAIAKVYLRIIAEQCEWICNETKFMK